MFSASPTATRYAIFDEVQDERKVVLNDRLAFERRWYCDPHAIRMQSVVTLT